MPAQQSNSRRRRVITIVCGAGFIDFDKEKLLETKDFFRTYDLLVIGSNLLLRYNYRASHERDLCERYANGLRLLLSDSRRSLA